MGLRRDWKQVLPKEDRQKFGGNLTVITLAKASRILWFNLASRHIRVNQAHQKRMRI